MVASIDLVVTRFKERLDWIEPYLHRPGWHVHIYNTGRAPPPAWLCEPRGAARCTQLPNAGYEWHGYLRHLVDRHSELADTTVFMQGDPLTVSPDAHCLLNQTRAYAPIQARAHRRCPRRRAAAARVRSPHPAVSVPPAQVLSWVQMAKRAMPIFSDCSVSYLGGCRVWVEPVTAGLRPMLHGDRWLHRACRMAKRFKGSLYQFLYSQLAADPRLSTGPAETHRRLIRSQPVPPRLYRAYGAQFAASGGALRSRPRGFYARLLKWLTTPHDEMGRAGFLPVWRAYTTKEKAILLELIWMALLHAERYIERDVCASCLAAASRSPKEEGAVGASCDADYFSGAPRVEACNVTGDGWGGPPSKRLKAACPVTKNDDEMVESGRGGEPGGGERPARARQRQRGRKKAAGRSQ